MGLTGADMENDKQVEGHADSGGDGREEARLSGRARVRDLLLLPISGLKRPTKARAEDYDRLADQLAYMREDALLGLCEFVLRMAGGSPVPVAVPKCPDAGVIRAWAYQIQPPPPRDSDYVASVMRSALGREACDGGWHVQLYRYLRRCGPPLGMGEYQRGKLREEAADDLRRLARVRERSAAGVAGPEDRRWLAAWHDDSRDADALVEEGDMRRAAKAQAACGGGAESAGRAA